MPIEQRDVYLLPFPLGKGENHLHIVLSVSASNNTDRCFIAAMITSSDIYYDELSFDLTDEMFDKPLMKDNCHVRCHLTMLCLNSEIIGNENKPLNRMKEASFKRLMAHIGEMVFNYNFTPLS